MQIMPGHVAPILPPLLSSYGQPPPNADPSQPPGGFERFFLSPPMLHMPEQPTPLFLPPLTVPALPQPFTVHITLSLPSDTHTHTSSHVSSHSTHTFTITARHTGSDRLLSFTRALVPSVLPLSRHPLPVPRASLDAPFDDALASYSELLAFTDPSESVHSIRPPLTSPQSPPHYP